MIEFTILKKSKRSRARLGVLKTPHGEVETPTLVPVATQAVVKTLTSEEAHAAQSQMLIVNTFHLHLRPGEGTIRAAGGLHEFMHWPKPLMTDSGGFQVFSLGFGKEFGMGKLLKKSSNMAISAGQQSRLLKITPDGVLFTSYIEGEQIFLGPRESIKIQEALGADIMFAFDECTSPIATHEYTKHSLAKTHRWARICLESKRTQQALYGIVQGGKFKDLRIESAQLIASLPFEGFGIGGEFGDNKKNMLAMLRWVNHELPEIKPRHLLGIGYMGDIPKIIKAGVDTFDCTLPTHYARHGIAFTAQGKLDLNKSKFLRDKKALDPQCSCFVCRDYQKSYIGHLVKAKEITGLKLLTFHNLYFFNSFVEKLRKDIKKGKL